MIVELLDLVVDRQDQKQRQRRQNDHEHHARSGKLLLPLRGWQTRVAEKREHLTHHGHNVPPVDDTDGNERAQMQQNIEKQMAVFRRRHVKQVLQDGQMAGAGDRQKLCDALHQTEYNRIPDAHGHTSQCADMNV